MKITAGPSVPNAATSVDVAASVAISGRARAPLIAPVSQAIGGHANDHANRHDGQAERAYGWLMMALLLLFVVNIFVFASRPAEGNAYAVIVPPHLGQPALMETIAAAGGSLVRESRYPWLAIVSPANASAEAGFASALRRSGALLLLHPALLAGCFTPEPHIANVADRQPSAFLF